MAIRVVLVDDNKNIHDVISRIIAEEDDIVLIGQAYDGESGIQLCKIAKPDLILMDVVMPNMNGAETTTSILKILPTTKILTLSSYQEYEYIREMLDSGAIGYLVKDGLVQDLIATIRSIMLGNTVFSPEVAAKILNKDLAENESKDFGMSERELQVLKLMADGLTYSGIAHELRISSPTVRFHVNNILEKMKVETRSQALVLGAKNNLF